MHYGKVQIVCEEMYEFEIINLAWMNWEREQLQNKKRISLLQPWNAIPIKVTDLL